MFCFVAGLPHYRNFEKLQYECAAQHRCRNCPHFMQTIVHPVSFKSNSFPVSVKNVLVYGLHIAELCKNVAVGSDCLGFGGFLRNSATNQWQRVHHWMCGGTQQSSFRCLSTCKWHVVHGKYCTSSCVSLPKKGKDWWLNSLFFYQLNWSFCSIKKKKVIFCFVC